MEVEFWKHQVEILFFWPFMIICSVICTVAGIILMIKEIFYWPLLVSGIIMLLICIYAIIFQKRVLSKVIFSDVGIRVKRLKKEIIFMDWSDITEVTSTSYARGGSYLSFIAGDKQIDVTLTKKMYNTIMILCPYQGIKTMINAINIFKWFHRKK